LNAEAHKSIHSISGTFAAAAAAGSMMGLNAQKMRWAMDYAAQQASGIAAWQRDTEHIEKAFVFAGMPARDGLTAALLVQAGATGVDDILSGSDKLIEDITVRNFAPATQATYVQQVSLFAR